MTPIVVLVLVLGLAVGSFLNVCISRLPRGMSVVLPRSHCPQCEHRLSLWENLPLVSFLLLRGRCRKCRQPIGWTYPTVELVNAVLYVVLLERFSWGPAFLLNALFFSALLVLMVIDLRHRILPDVITIPGIIIAFLLAPLQSFHFFGTSRWPGDLGIWTFYVQSLLGIVLGGGVLWAVAQLYVKLRRVEGMGFGDIKMMAMVGALLGWRYAWLTIFWGSLLGSLSGALYILISGKGKRYELPFGTFLGVGAIISTLWGPAILSWYLQSF